MAPESELFEPRCSAAIHSCYLPDADRRNAALLAAYDRLGPEDFARRTHFFGGRFENLYLDRGRLPELAAVLGWAEHCADRILGMEPGTLKCGFWFNVMGPGDSTTEHTHEEIDELLSAVYYVEAPEGSGDIVLFDDPLTIRVQPESGMFLFFPPELSHLVEVNQSGRQRLSIGINFGPRGGL